MKRLVIAGGIAAAVLLIVVLQLSRGFEPADAFVDRWLHSVVGDGAPDRGWNQLDESTRLDRFANDPEAYRVAAAAQDWSGFRWTVEAPYQLESWLWHVYIRVEGGLAATPAFLWEQKLVGPWCLDDTGPGIALQVSQEGQSVKRTLGPGGFTGSTEHALATRACVQASMAAEQFLPGAEMVWEGHQLSVWNWTTLPLFLLGDDGRRVDLPACTKIALDDFAREFAVRAANGYVMTIGLGGPYDGVTTFVVIGSRDAYVNNAPPAEPIPPCEGEPQVQVGV